LAKLLDCDPQDWRAALGLAAPRRQLFLSREQILKLQGELSEGDEVWVISCREFLETEDDTIEELVRSNLKKGVVYRYFFPVRGNSGDHAFGTAAADTYADFKRSLNVVEFEVTPRLVGFGLDTRMFPYFSKLHTLLYFKRPRGADLPLAYIEYEGEGGAAQPPIAAWYRLKREDFSAIKAALQRACDPIADIGLEFKPMNPRLGNIRRLYINSFASDSNASLYERVRELIGTSQQCAREVLNAFAATTRNFNTELRLLDTGCGDGTITAQIVAGLTHSGYSVDVTLLDAAPDNVTVAQARARDGSPTEAQIRVAGVKRSFEEAEFEGEFDLVTAVHSLYVVDTDYLRKLYALLRPGGVVCIWMGSLKDNVLNRLCDAIDRVLRPSQQRNYAEDIYSALENFGLGSSGLRKDIFRKHIPALVDGHGCLNDQGRLITQFFAMQRLDASLETAAAAAIGMPEGDGHSLQDWLIRFQRKP
jgi:SAM-dependent methyltransferase